MNSQPNELIILDASIESFESNYEVASATLLAFLDRSAQTVHRLSIDPEAHCEPLLEAAFRAQERIQELISPKRGLFRTTDVLLDSSRPEMRKTFADWAYWSTEATVVDDSLNILFELTDGGHPAEYSLHVGQAKSFVHDLNLRGLKIPTGWARVMEI